jgi:flagellar hook-associated protein 2
MSTSYEDYDAASLASAMVTAERAGIDELLSEKSDKYSALVDGYESLQTYLEDFQDALDDYADASSDTSFSAQTCTTSEDDYFTVESDGSAASGNYYITVDQLAQNYQAALTFDSTSTELPSDGTLSFTVDGETMTVDLSTLEDNSLSNLVSAINNDDDNPGVTASLIKSGDSVMLLITSDETGADYTVDMTYTEGTSSDASTTLSDALTNKTVLSTAQDAIIELGATNTVTITSSSNSLENVIDGLTIDLTKAQTDEDDDDPILVTVEVDSDTVEDNLQSFVDTFNTLVDNLTSLYDDGDLDGDSTVRTLISQLKNAMRNSLPDDYTLDELGLEFDSDGTLSIDSDTLEDALAEDPDIITKALTDDGGLFDSIQDLLDPYTEDDGIISTMEDSAQDSLDRVTERQEAWDTKMENLYNEYLEDFTQMKIALAQLESSLSVLST